MFPGKDYLRRRKISGSSRGARKETRQTDYVGMLDGGLYVLLSDTEEKNALGVITRFAEAGYESTIANGEVAA